MCSRVEYKWVTCLRVSHECSLSVEHSTLKCQKTFPSRMKNYLPVIVFKQHFGKHCWFIKSNCIFVYTLTTRQDTHVLLLLTYNCYVTIIHTFVENDSVSSSHLNAPWLFEIQQSTILNLTTMIPGGIRLHCKV